MVLLLPSLAEFDECKKVTAFVGLVVGDDVVDSKVSLVGVVEVLVDVLHGLNVEGEHEHVAADVVRFCPDLLESLCPLLKASDLAV